MKKRIFGIQIRAIIGFLAAVLLLMTASVAYHQSQMTLWLPQEGITGQWSGENEVSGPFKKGVSPSEYPEDWVELNLTILPDGTVTGTAGDAQLKNCKVMLNRTAFERKINIKTDYIIRGSLSGGITPDDTAAERTITIPFDHADGKIKGSLFEIEGWKYPYPLFPRMTLEKESE